LVDSDSLIHEFLNLVTALRTEQGLTHEQLSDMAQIHRTTVGLLQREERSPTLQIANQIANALGYTLSELILRAESNVQKKNAVMEPSSNSYGRSKGRKVKRANVRNEEALQRFAGLDSAVLIEAIESSYHTLDIIDEQLSSRNSPVVAELVELANLSSMVGNLLSAGIAEASNGLYKRNRPHAYPDLLPIKKPAVELELKMALETNRPKGHLPKPGVYITFRYVLGNSDGTYTRGKTTRGKTVWIWEAKIGKLSLSDFSLSNTEGDSGKTAVIKTDAFNSMPLIYFDQAYSPYPKRKNRPNYPGYN
jgi:transcriptional regulator with XRE-family HTH domain